DRVAEDVCRRRPGVVHIAAAAALREAPQTSAAYGELAAVIAPVLAEQLDRLAAKPAASDARSARRQPDPELERQRALDESGLATRGTNPRLDRLLRSARELFGTVGAAVTLVDGDRVLFKAAIGLDDKEVPRSVSPCDRTIRQNGAHVL